MDKKNFANSPALAYISSAAQKRVVPEEVPEVESAKEPENLNTEEQNINTEQAEPKAENSAASIDVSSVIAKAVEEKKKQEVKNHRVQLVLTESLYSKVKAASQNAGLSVNGFISVVLDAATRK